MNASNTPTYVYTYILIYNLCIQVPLMYILVYNFATVHKGNNTENKWLKLNKILCKSNENAGFGTGTAILLHNEFSTQALHGCFKDNGLCNYEMVSGPFRIFPEAMPFDINVVSSVCEKKTRLGFHNLCRLNTNIYVF